MSFTVSAQSAFLLSDELQMARAAPSFTEATGRRNALSKRSKKLLVLILMRRFRITGNSGMTRRFIIIASALILIAAVVGGTIGRSRRFRHSVPRKWMPLLTPKLTISRRITTKPLQPSTVEYAGDIDYEKATQAAIQGMLSTLDPHSMYFPYNEFKKLKEDQDSRFYGIGVTIVQHRDGVYVQSAVEGTPAGRLGLRYGDRILEVDGQDARDWTSEQVSKKVRAARANR